MEFIVCVVSSCIYTECCSKPSSLGSSNRLVVINCIKKSIIVFSTSVSQPVALAVNQKTTGSKFSRYFSFSKKNKTLSFFLIV